MPTIVLSISTILLLICSYAQAQNCALSGKQSWNQSLRNIIADCPEKFDSPNRRFVVRVTSGGSLSAWSNSGREKLQWDALKLEPPAMIAWSPESTAFFLNDGEGSGMSSSFRLFRLKGNRIIEDASIERSAVLLYRHRTGCTSSAADPNVWGFGWDTRGSTIFLLIQPTVNESCGKPEEFISVVVRESDGVIVETLSKTQTETRFGPLLPAAMFSK